MNLHEAAAGGTVEQVAELAAQATDVDELEEGRTALWWAVFEHQRANALALVAAGADPWRPMMSGWSPARLAAAGPAPDLFGTGAELRAAETAAVEEAIRLPGVLWDVEREGLGLTCVAGIDVAEAVRRLAAVPCDREESLDVVGATDVPGGVVLAQPWGFRPAERSVLERLSAGTVCYGLYVNPKSGDQGASARDGVITGWDLFPGGDVAEDAPAEEVLLTYLYRFEPVAFTCAYAGLRLTDSRAIAGEPDVWLRVLA
jgi:hypothetical protein